MVYFCVQPNAKHHARVMTGEKASPSRLEPCACQWSGFPGDAGADGVDVGLLAHEFDAQPVVSFGCLVSQEYRRSIVGGDENIHRPIVVEVAQGQTARGQGEEEYRPGGCADVFEGPAIVVKEKQGFAIGDTAGVDFNLVVRMTVGNEEIDVAVVVVIEKA